MWETVERGMEWFCGWRIRLGVWEAGKRRELLEERVCVYVLVEKLSNKYRMVAE